ncbi:Eukaryotic translation initiation factor 3 subunit A [Actinoplanes sp. SE50/110]|nr:Eukaryotic translation initiation factor 3 subunit A [Actinoplanes sp. SE50/110]
MDQREWDYGARMSRERRAADPWLTREREAEIDDAEPRWSALTDTGSMTPSPEALTWQRRADAWAQQSEIEPYSGGGGQAVEPANRWSDVAATGRPTFPADGTGWRTQTSEWRATGARWRQTTEWRSSTGSHVWRSTTEAWQPGDDDEQQQPTISGTAWPTPEDNTRDVSSSWSATKPVEQTWSSSGTPSWQQPATSWDSGRRTPGENTTDVAGWDRSGGSGWQSGPRDDGRHYVREDDRAAWRQADTEWSTRRGRRRAPEPDEQPSGGSGWSSGDETDNWAGHADTGNISYAPTSAPSFGSRSVRRGPQPPPPDDAAAAQRGQTPIQFGVRPGSRRAAPDEGPSGPIDTGAASAGQPERQRGQSRRGRGPQRYNANPTNWREDTASWDAEPDTSNWTRDPDTGQWSRAEDDPRVLAWRAEAARRDQMRQGDADEQPGRGEQPTPDGAVGWGGRRGQWDDEPSGPIGGVPGGPLPSSAVPDGPGSRPRSAMPAPRSAMPAPRSVMPSQRIAMPSQRSAMPSQRSATPSSGGAGWAAGGAPWNGADQPDPYSSGRIHADQPDAYTSGRIRADQGPGRFGAEQYDSGGRRRAPEADSGSWDARQGRPTGPEDDYAADGRRQGPMPPRALPAGRSGWPQQAGPRELPAGPSGSTTPEQSWPDRGQEQAGYGARQYGYETPRRTGAPETDGTFDLRRATGGNAGWSDPRSADPVGNSWSDPRSTGPADAAWTDARRGDVSGGRSDLAPRRRSGCQLLGRRPARRAAGRQPG